MPVLLYIGLVIGAQAFGAVPRAHAAGVVLAMIPNIAAWASGLVAGALSAAGTSAGTVGETALANAGIINSGLLQLGEGAVLAGMVLGAIAVLLIDRRFVLAGIHCFVGAALATVGLIHGGQVGLWVSTTRLPRRCCRRCRDSAAAPRRRLRAHHHARGQRPRLRGLILSGCTGATDPDNHRAALRMVTMQGGVLGAVATSDALLAAL